MLHRRALLSIPVVAAAPAGAAPPPASWTAPAAQRLADRLARLDADGLDPAVYAAPADDPAGLRRAAAAALGDLVLGRVRDLPGRVDLRRDLGASAINPWLAELTASAEPAAVLDRAANLHPDAAALKAALAIARAQAAAGPWPTVPGSGADTLEPGGFEPVRVPALRARLAATDPGVAAGVDPLYDPGLVDAVRRFQAAEGLEADGRIGRATLAALNRSPEVVVRQLRVALDQRRGFAPPAAERRIEVNIAHQRLSVWQGERLVLDMAVIVGRPDRQTPMLRTRLTTVQFNPPWGVPERNAREDLLPRFRRDPQAMLAKGFRVYGFVDGERVEIDATQIDWRSVNPERFPYVIRQDAGDANALGRIKFVIPNSEAIFMHDTPERGLFRRDARAFSSGCIRLEQPMALLALALEGTAGWDSARAQRAIDARSTSAVGLARSMPVRLHYTTAVVENGAVRLRPDIYGLDEAYARALDGRRNYAAVVH